MTVVQDGTDYYATATSEKYTAAGVAGTYRWVAHFDGDANNVDADSACNAANESTDVKKANPCVTTDIVGQEPGADAVLGQAGTDDHGPRDAVRCHGQRDRQHRLHALPAETARSATPPTAPNATPVTTVTKTIVASQTEYEASYTVTDTGWYNWTAQYVPGGDVEQQRLGGPRLRRRSGDPAGHAGRAGDHHGRRSRTR